MKQHILSIVVPMYNVEQYIEKCIRSIEEQDVNRALYEVLIVNDGSSDKSVSVVNKLQKEFPNITLIHKENGGASSARNVGIERASGEYIWFVDSDDFIEPNVLEYLFSLLERYDLDYLGFGIYDIKVGERKDGFEKVKRPQNIISGLEYIRDYDISKSPCTHILKTDIYRKYNIRFIEGVIYEDYDFVLRMYKHCDRMKFVALPVYNYVIRESGSVTSIKSYSQNRLSFNSWEFIINSLQNDFNNCSDEYSYYARYWINNYKYIALTNLLIKPLPFAEKKVFYTRYKDSGFLKIGHNHLSLKRKMRAGIYCIPFIYPIMMYLCNSNYER